MYLWLVGCLLCFLVLFFLSSCPLYAEASSIAYALAFQENRIKVSINGYEIMADIAISTEQRAKGLSI
jgi:hypothetical protein